jgi:hypothetical protein
MSSCRGVITQPKGGDEVKFKQFKRFDWVD